MANEMVEGIRSLINTSEDMASSVMVKNQIKDAFENKYCTVCKYFRWKFPPVPFLLPWCSHPDNGQMAILNNADTCEHWELLEDWLEIANGEQTERNC